VYVHKSALDSWLKRTFRLTLTKDIQRVKREGQSFSHPLMVMLAAMNDLSKTRVAVVAGKSVGKAVVRNRAKRRLRALISGLLPKIKTGYDLILIARKPIVDAEYPALQAALQGLLQKAELMH